MTISISKQQMKMLEPFVLENYISELIFHCDASFPHLKKIMGEEQLRLTLKTAVDQAEKSGFTQKGPIQFYVDMLVVFGWGFENDPQYSWIQASLQKNKDKSQIEQATILHHQIEEYLDKISGRQNQYLFQAAEKLEQLKLENISVSKNTFVQDMLNISKETFPQKFQLSGEKQLTKLIEEGLEKGIKNYRFEDSNHIALIAILMFLLGHKFDEDPFYKWASKEKIRGNNFISHDVIAKKLEKRAKIWLRAAVKNEYSAMEDKMNSQELDYGVS